VIFLLFFFLSYFFLFFSISLLTFAPEFLPTRPLCLRATLFVPLNFTRPLPCCFHPPFRHVFHFFLYFKEFTPPTPFLLIQFPVSRCSLSPPSPSCCYFSFPPRAAQLPLAPPQAAPHPHRLTPGSPLANFKTVTAGFHVESLPPALLWRPPPLVVISQKNMG